jgi:uncharacterized membrane protein
METLFPGLHAMHNLHPLFVHFPIALFVAAFVIQVIVVLGKRDAMQSLASALLYLGTLGVLPTALTGWLAEEKVETLAGFTPAMGAALEFHSTVMYVVTGSAVLLTAMAFWKRARMTRGMAAVLLAGLLVLVTLLGVGADRGGQLVYQYGVGGQKLGTEVPRPSGP